MLTIDCYCLRVVPGCSKWSMPVLLLVLLWDISLNSDKSHCIGLTFGGCYPTSFLVVLNNVELKRVHKLKYLGCYFTERSCRIDHCYGISKFYGNFNNILAVAGQKKNDVSTLHSLLCCMVVKYGIRIVLITTVLMLCGIIPPRDSSAVVGGSAHNAYCSILGHSLCLLWLTNIRFLFEKML